MKTTDMIEIFKTNVHHRDEAKMLVTLIQESFDQHRASFDLEDCDRILRVTCHNGPVQSVLLMALLKNSGYEIGILPDEPAALTTPEVKHPLYYFCWARA